MKRLRSRVELAERKKEIKHRLLTRKFEREQVHTQTQTQTQTLNLTLTLTLTLTLNSSTSHFSCFFFFSKSANPLAYESPPPRTLFATPVMIPSFSPQTIMIGQFRQSVFFPVLVVVLLSCSLVLVLFLVLVLPFCFLVCPCCCLVVLFG